MSLVLKVAAAVFVPLIVTAGTALPAAASSQSLTADQLASRANADLKAASSYHLWGSIGSGKTAVTLNITRGHDACKGTLGGGGSTVGFVQVGAMTWVEVDGQWLPMTTAKAGATLTYCAPGTVAGLVKFVSGLSMGPLTTISHQRVRELKGIDVTIYVSTGAKPEYVRFAISAGKEKEQFNFAGINAPVTITAPPGQ